MNAAAMASWNRAAVLVPPFVIGVLTGFTLLMLQQSLSPRIPISFDRVETATVQNEHTPIAPVRSESLTSFEEIVPFRYNTSAVLVDGKLNVHLVAHSHDDLGWLKTIDQYYVDPVQYIIETVVDQLSDNPDRRFIQVEQRMGMAVSASMMEYATFAGGAYIFQPSKPAMPITSTNATYQVPIHIQRGPIVEEFSRQITPWISEVFRVYPGGDYAELHYSVGPLPAKQPNHEVVTRFVSPINSSKAFYSDSNGRSYLKRVVDYRSDWDLNVTDPIAGNYYPLTVGAFIKDKEAQLSVLVDRAAGAASLASGQIEVMLHRKLSSLDGKGVGEPLQERIALGNRTRSLTVVGLLRFGLHLNTGSEERAGEHEGEQGEERVGLGQGSEWRRQHAQHLLTPLQLSFAVETQQSIRAAQGSYTWHYSLSQPSSTSASSTSSSKPNSASSYSVPPNVAVITMQELSPSTVVLRLAHLYQPGEHAAWSRPAQVDLRRLFAAKQIHEVTELSLMANQKQADMRQPLSWRVEGEEGVEGAGDENRSARESFVDPASLVVELGPAEIRTFSIRLQGST